MSEMLAACLTCGDSENSVDRAAALRWHMQHECPDDEEPAASAQPVIPAKNEATR